MIEKLPYDALENITDDELNQLKEKYEQEKETLESYHYDYQYLDKMLSYIHNEEINRNICNNIGKYFKDDTLYICIYDTDISLDFYQLCYNYKYIAVCTDEDDLSIIVDRITSSTIEHCQSITKEEFNEVYKNVATKLFELTKGTKK